jgi:hypothetical protein
MLTCAFGMRDGVGVPFDGGALALLDRVETLTEKWEATLKRRCRAQAYGRIVS